MDLAEQDDSLEDSITESSVTAPSSASTEMTSQTSLTVPMSESSNVTSNNGSTSSNNKNLKGQNLASSHKSEPKGKKVIADSWEDEAEEESHPNDAEDFFPGDISDDQQQQQTDKEIEKGFLNIHRAFVKLRAEFDTKFRKMFA